MKSTENIEKLISKINAAPSAQMVQKTLDDILLAQQKTNKISSADKQPNIWRIIMKNRITKLAAAAVILIAIGVSFMFMEKTTTPAYALEQTIEAYNSIYSLHISEFETVGLEKRPSKLWITCDYDGRLDKMRWEAPNSGGAEIGEVTVVSDGNTAEVWFKNHNLCFKTLGNGEGMLRWDPAELNPKLIFERLFEQQELGRIILNVNEPKNAAEPFVVTVTYPQGSLSEDYEKVLYIDQATKLVNKIEKFQMKENKYHHVRTAEFSNYNDEIDPKIFTLEGELPENIVYLDRSDEQIGLAQGNMTDEQVVAEVGRKFFEAIIAKNYNQAGLMWSAVPGLILEKFFVDVNAIEIISVGQSRHNPDPDSTSMIGSCKVLLETGGQKIELDAFLIFVKRLSTHPDRWVISGIASRTQPIE